MMFHAPLVLKSEFFDTEVVIMSKDAHFPLDLRVFGIAFAIVVSFSNSFAAAAVSPNNSQQTLLAYNAVRAGSYSNGNIVKPSGAFKYETENFVILNAPTDEMAKQFGKTAEKARKELAILWFGKPMPNWSAKCPVRVKVGDYGASGETSFIFDRGEVFGWEMSVQGTRERIVDSVLPHEISHTVFASMFRKKLPRWIDEGAATSVEHESERANYRRLLLKYVDPEVRRAIPFNRMVEMTEYPKDIMPFYSQGNSVAEFLIGQGGHRRFAAFAKRGMDSGSWNTAIREFYGYTDLGDLQTTWIKWVGAGFPNVNEYEPAIARMNLVSPAHVETKTSRPIAVRPMENLDQIPYYTETGLTLTSSKR